MNVREQIKKYIDTQPEAKRSDMQALHLFTIQLSPACRWRFLDVKNSEKNGFQS